MTIRWNQALGQALLYGLFALFVGVFSSWPRYQVLPPGEAVLKVSFIHHGQRVAPCRPRRAAGPRRRGASRQA